LRKAGTKIVQGRSPFLGKPACFTVAVQLHTLLQKNPAITSHKSPTPRPLVSLPASPSQCSFTPYRRTATSSRARQSGGRACNTSLSPSTRRSSALATSELYYFGHVRGGLMTLTVGSALLSSAVVKRENAMAKHCVAKILDIRAASPSQVGFLFLPLMCAAI
jgi:hypothetical protein